MAAPEDERRAHADAVDQLEALLAPVVVALMRRVLRSAHERLGFTGELRAATSPTFVSLDDLAVIEAEWAKGVTAELVPALQTVYETGALAALLRHGTGELPAPIAHVVDRLAVTYMAGAANRLRDVGARLWDAARTSLSEGMSNGETMDDLAARLRGVLDVGEVRAMTIARTEVIGAVNAGGLAGERALGGDGATHKQWMATLGPRTRDEHAAADGQVVPISEPFDVGGEALDYPGDPSGSAWNVVNCRCTLAFVDSPEGIDLDAPGRESVVDDVVDAELLASLTAARSVGQTGDVQTITRSPDGRSWVVSLTEGSEPLLIGPEHPDYAAWSALYAAEQQDSTSSTSPGFAVEPAVEGVGERTSDVLDRPEQFHAVMVVEGIETGDGRKFAEGALTWVDPPFALGWQRETDHNSVPAGAMQVGLVTRVERRGNSIHGWGHFDEGSEIGAEAARQVREGFLRWGSVDPDDIAESDVELVYPEGVDPEEDPFAFPELVVFNAGRLRGFTLCSISALVEATVEWVGEGAASDEPADDEQLVAAAAEDLDEGTRVTWSDGAGEHTGTVQSVDEDAGTAQVVEDGTDEPVEVAVDQLEVVTDDEDDEDDEEDPLAAAGYSLTVPDVPPAWWFDEPVDVALDGALTITDEGRVYGYLAPGGVSHIAPQFRGRTAPRNVDLSRFLRGETIVEGGGRVVTGNVTMDCGHGALHNSPQRTVEHYDNSCSLFARVNAGIDAKGNTWVAGALYPGVTGAQVARAMGLQLSGHWQPTPEGRTGLYAGLLVPVPGFPMARKRPSVTLRDGQLVASAVPVRLAAERPSVPFDSIAERIAASIGRDRQSRAAALAARVHGSV